MDAGSEQLVNRKKRLATRQPVRSVRPAYLDASSQQGVPEGTERSLRVEALSVPGVRLEELRVRGGTVGASVEELVEDEPAKLRRHLGGKRASEQGACHDEVTGPVGSEGVDESDDVVGILGLVASHDRVGLQAQP